MSKEEIQALLRRNTAPDKQSISTEEGLEVARTASKAAQAQGIVCALAGGLAMHLYGFTRATMDVNMVANQPLNWAIKDKLSFGGVRPDLQILCVGQSKVEDMLGLMILGQ